MRNRRAGVDVDRYNGPVEANNSSVMEFSILREAFLSESPLSHQFECDTESAERGATEHDDEGRRIAGARRILHVAPTLTSPNRLPGAGLPKTDEGRPGGNDLP